MSERPTEAEFVDHVRREFTFLVSKYSMRLILDDSRLERFCVLFENSTVSVSVRGVDFGSGTEVRIGPAPYRNRSSGWPLWLICRLRAPSLLATSWWEIGGQLEQATRGAKQLDAVCSDFLGGDFTESARMDAEFKKETERNIEAWRKHDEELAHVRAVDIANEAFRSRDYVRVIQQLEAVHAMLKPSELLKLEYAKRKVKAP